MTPEQQQTTAMESAAFFALDTLPDAQRADFLCRSALGISDPAAIPALLRAGSVISAHARRLMQNEVNAATPKSFEGPPTVLPLDGPRDAARLTAPAVFPRRRGLFRRVWPWVADAFGVLCLFGMLWAGLIIGWAVQ